MSDNNIIILFAEWTGGHAVNLLKPIFTSSPAALHHNMNYSLSVTTVSLGFFINLFPHYTICCAINLLAYMHGYKI